jgi:hypothetical protein
MSPQVLLPLQPETLRSRVIDSIRQRWIKPSPEADVRRFGSTPGFETPKDHVEAISRSVLNAMLTRPFRNSKFPSEQDYARQLRCVRHWVRRGRPIRVSMGYAPMKNLNAARVSRADWAEFFALCHLCAWHNKAQAIYPPGLKIKIVFDDAAVGLANRPDHHQMDSYINSVGQLVSMLGYDSFIRGIGRHSSFAWLFHIAPFPLARLHLRIWESNPANQAVIQRMNTYARRNLVLPSGLSEEELERLCRKASHRYRLYWEALLIALWIQRVTFFGNSLVAMYLDGNQHHIPLKGALHLTTLGKGQITQPWQGEGALCDNGHGQLVPFVLTTSRRAAVNRTEVSNLDLLPLEGFDRIEVCSGPGDLTPGSEGEPSSVTDMQ